MHASILYKDLEIILYNIKLTLIKEIVYAINSKLVIYIGFLLN